MTGTTGIAPSISRKYPTNRDIGLRNGYTWLEGRRLDEEAEGLWRIYDNLYDLTDFVNKHPGGKDWLLWTKGCDITEAYESHHLTSLPDSMLPKYFVRKAKRPRNFKITFEENGFYRTLKRRVVEKLKTLDKSKRNQTRWIIDGCFAITLILAVLAAKTGSLLLAAASGVFLTWTSISAHNYFHQRDNWRMRLFNLTLMSYREWRISHALSHHIYPNTLHDLEISSFEQVLPWLPSDQLKATSGLKRYLPWLASPILYGLVFYLEFLKRYLSSKRFDFQVFFWDDFAIPLIVPVVMFVFGTPQLTVVIPMWLLILWVASFTFAVIGINASHHHPDIFHDGDAVHPSVDFGMMQCDAIMDRADLRGNLILTLTHFGDHALHHLFPTVDHAFLPDLEPILIQTLKDFECDFRTSSWWNLIAGQFEQLTRVEKNPVPIALRKKKL